MLSNSRFTLSPSFFLPRKAVLFGGKLMGHWASLCLKLTLSVKIFIKGKGTYYKWGKKNIRGKAN